MFRGKPTRDHHKDTYKVKKEVILAGQWLHRELAKTMQYQALQTFAIHKSHILVVTHWLVRSRSREAQKQG